MDNDVIRVICKNIIDIIGLDRWINIIVVIKFSLRIVMGIDNPVTSLKPLSKFSLIIAFLKFIFQIEENQGLKMIIVILSLWLYWEIFYILEYFTGATCLTICYITLIDKKMDNR